MTSILSLIFILHLHIACSLLGTTTINRWSLLLSDIGIPAMHIQLLPNDRVLIFDRTDFGASNISLPHDKCRNDPNDPVLKKDCTAHSVEYDVASNTVRPLMVLDVMVLTDVWCSSGALMPNGSVIQTGGYNYGDHVVRVFNSCDTCDWEELKSGLINRRWYATNHILPGGRQIIIGGRRQFNYEFYPKVHPRKKLIVCRFYFRRMIRNSKTIYTHLCSCFLAEDCLVISNVRELNRDSFGEAVGVKY